MLMAGMYVCTYVDEREREGGGRERGERERAEITMLMAGMYVHGCTLYVCTLMRGRRKEAYQW